jgi:putative transposase
LNEFGKMIHKWWNQIPQKYPNIELDEFVVMPNHLQGIILIHDNNSTGNIVGARSPRPYNGSCMSRKSKKSQPTLGNTIAYFKYQSTKNVNNLRQTPGVKLWQRNYYACPDGNRETCYSQ